MGTRWLLVVVFVLVACTSPEERERDALMDRIETKVKLPDGAWPLPEYARHYALDDKGIVVGVYAPGYQPPSHDATCEEFLEDLTTREVPCPEPESDRLLAGQRRWVGNTDELPVNMDGGCAIVTVFYDPKADAVTSATCNGRA
ncbi:MAG: hypothetical protein H0T82_11595 [Sphingomonas sp.]|nr:hypothetical protein [Sphingomonas sp.]